MKVKVKLKDKKIAFTSKYGEEELTEYTTIPIKKDNINYRICLGYLKC